MLTVTGLLPTLHRRHTNQLAVTDDAGHLTYGELIDRAWALSRGLRDAGVRPGDTVGVLTGNSRFAAETYLGIAAAGAVAVLYNWRWAVPELVFGINDSRAEIVLVEEPWADRLGAAGDTGELESLTRVVAQGDNYEAFLQPGPAPEVEVGPDDPNVILYTGGTTGFSKGVVLSHANVLANAFNEIIDTDMERDDVTLLITPMFHSASLLCWFLPHIVLGARAVFVRDFDEEYVGEVMEREGVTNGFLVPNMVRRMLASGQFASRDLSTYRRMYVGGATLRLPDKLAVRETLPHTHLYYQYGLTEGGPIVSVLRPEDMYRDDVDGSIGKEFVLTTVSIRDPQTGDELPAGEPGELCVSGPNVMQGYFGRKEDTEHALRGGWLHTGDIASRDDEGFIFFLDRLKDMIKTGGENVYSQEVEQVLYSHDGIVESAVIGVASAEWDEEVRAVVALREGHALTEDDIRGYCRGRLAGYKVPKRIAILPMSEMPVNPSGKIMKTQLRAQDLWDETGP
jgi:acyl-CoA synthetase (AMP-forming)/AMP-acid ligase II